jgi:hypothetical protein
MARLALAQEPREEKGDPDLTLEAVSSWTAGQRRCRGRKRHNWGPGMVYEHRSYYEVVEQCSHCRNRRTADFVKTARGLRKEGKWKPDYRNGYLLPKGARRIDDDLQEELVAADILSRKTIEVPDSEE